jgi:hypothetical protein
MSCDKINGYQKKKNLDMKDFQNSIISWQTCVENTFV